MKYIIVVSLILGGLLAFNEISTLKKRINSQDERLNELAKLTGHKELSSYWVSDEMKELVLHLKRTEKEVEAIKKIREHTNMSLLEAKQYVDNLE